VGQPSAGAHLEHHDDALPGGTTSQTGTVLDAECEEVKANCPCDFKIIPQTTEYWLPGDPIHFHHIRDVVPEVIHPGELCALFSAGVFGNYFPWAAIGVEVLSPGSYPVGEATFSECGTNGVVCVCTGWVALDAEAMPFFDIAFSHDVLDSQEAYACASAINSYAFELNNVADISVMSEGDVPCRTAP
jgi:hypothetical protein